MASTVLPVGRETRSRAISPRRMLAAAPRILSMLGERRPGVVLDFAVNRGQIVRANAMMLVGCAFAIA